MKLTTDIEVIKADLNRSQDQLAILQLLDLYAQDPMGGDKALSEYTKQNLIPELSKRPGIEVLLAYHQGQATGLLIAMPGFSTFLCKPLLNIHDVVVAPAFRRRGIATALFSEIEKIATGQGCCKLTLEVLQGNIYAKAAYAKFGFTGYELDPAAGQALFWEKKLNALKCD